MKRLLTLCATMAVMGSAIASAPVNVLSLPGYFGSINNNTGKVLECSQVIGGYCANNPMPANGYIQMLPDPGSHEIRAHVMVIDPHVAGHYVDNLIFVYKEQKNGSWGFSYVKSLQGKVRSKAILPDTLVLTSLDGSTGAKS